MTGRRVEAPVWQPGWWMANIWLFFLIFPVLTILSDDQLTATRRNGTLLLLALFAVLYAQGYRVLIKREMGLLVPKYNSGLRRFIDPARSELWFGLLIATLVAGWVLGGWGVLGATPFIVTFAIFHLGWLAAGVTFASCMALVVLGPLIIGEFGRLWFLAAVVLVSAGPAALARVGIEREHDVHSLELQLTRSEERARVARDVHDVLGHSLTAIVLKTQVIDRMLAAVDDPAPEVRAAREQLAETEAVSRRALSEIRSTVSGLRSAELGAELAAARSVLSDADIDLVVHGDPAQVPNRLHEALGWTVREAVTNIVRHADASNCSIELGRPGALLAVRDDGIGADAAREGNGLTGLRERLAEYGLALDVQTADGTALLVTANDGAA